MTKKRNIAKFISGLTFFVYWCWTSLFSLQAFIREDVFNWGHFALLFIPQIILALIFFLLLWPGKDSTDISSKFVSVFSILIACVLWVVGPLQSFFTLGLDARGISFSAFLYFFEVVAFGGLFIFILIRQLKHVRVFLKDYSSDIKTITKERVEGFANFLSSFPVKIARIGFLFAFSGYLLATPQLILFAGTSYEVAIKTVFIGLAVAPIITLLMYVLARRFLSGVYEILYSFGSVAKPKLVLSIENKIMLIALGVFLMAISFLFPLAWNFFENNISVETFLLGGGIMILELISISYISTKAFVYDLKRSLDVLKKGLTILQSGDKRYRINIRTGDEIEEIIDEFNKVGEKC